MAPEKNVYAVYGRARNYLERVFYGYVVGVDKKEAYKNASRQFPKDRSDQFFNRKFSYNLITVKGYNIIARKKSKLESKMEEDEDEEENEE